MRTERQIEGSRANGAKSRGPVTAEGKYNSSRNAMTHGLLVETIVLKSERSDRFLEILAELEEELQSETSIEHTLIEKMAAARWRQLRLWGMEKAAMEYQTRQQADSVGRGEDIPTRASLAFATLGDSRTLDVIMRYDSLCDRPSTSARTGALWKCGVIAANHRRPQSRNPKSRSRQGTRSFRSHLNETMKNHQTNPTTHCKQSNRQTRTRRQPDKPMTPAVILTSGSRLPQLLPVVKSRVVKLTHRAIR